MKIQKAAVIPIREHYIRPIVSHVMDSPATDMTNITMNEYMKVNAVDITNEFSVVTIYVNQVPSLLPSMAALASL